MSNRPCTCHPEDNPPVPCPHKYALQECRRSAELEVAAWMIREPGCEYGPTFGTENAAWSALTKAPPGSSLVPLYAVPQPAADEIERLIKRIPQAEAAQRERLAIVLGGMAARSWDEWDKKADPIDLGKAMAFEQVVELLNGPNKI